MDPHRLLIAVDDSEATRRAVEYVATVAPRDLRMLVLFHVLPPLPPAVLEHGGVSDDDAQEDAEEALRRARELRVRAERDAETGLFEWTRGRLLASGIAADAIVMRTSTAVSAKGIVGEILSAAREHRCRTVVVGRESFSRFHELFKRHIGDELIRTTNDLAIWVVQ